MNVDLLEVLYAAASAIGWLEWGKGFFPDAPSSIWRAASPGVVLGMALVFEYAPSFLKICVLALALMTLAYQNVIEWIRKLVENIPPKGPQ